MNKENMADVLFYWHRSAPKLLRLEVAGIPLARRGLGIKSFVLCI
jgi:hypothetical protein